MAGMRWKCFARELVILVLFLLLAPTIGDFFPAQSGPGILLLFVALYVLARVFGWGPGDGYFGGDD